MTYENSITEEESSEEGKIIENKDQKILENAEERDEEPLITKKEEEFVEERLYVIPLGKAWISPRKKHTPRAIRIIRSFIMKHMKVEKEAVKISNEVNEKIWSRGIEKPPRKIRVRVTKDSEGIIGVNLLEGE